MTYHRDFVTDGVLMLGLFFALGFFVLLWRYVRVSRHLAKARAQLQLVLDNVKEGVLVLNPDLTVVLMNNAGPRLISEPGEHTSYKQVQQDFDAFTPTGELLPHDQWPSSRALRGEFVQDFAITFCNKATGEVRSRIVSSAPVPPAAGSPGQIILSYRDDSVRLSIDRARMRLAAIVESSHDAIFSTTKDGIVTSWNRGAENITGYPAAEIIGQSILQLIPPDDLQAYTEICRRLLNDEAVDRCDAVRITKDGRRIDVDMSISQMKDQAGHIIGISSIMRDVTETHTLQRQLQQSQKMEAIGQLTGRVAHDFNNLLGIVIGNLDLLELQLPDHPGALHRIQIAQKAISRCAELTKRLLAFASNEQLTPKPTCIDDAIRNTIAMAGPALGPEISFTASLAENIPLVLVDPAGLENALLNLAINARDAMPNGGSLQISTATTCFDVDDPEVLSEKLRPGDYAIIAVSDNGLGMSRQTIERAFEPFFTTKVRGCGTGLGLAIVYGFAKQSNGAVSIYSEVGLGTTISLFLPLATQPVHQIKQQPPSVKSGGGTILLVDDEPELLHLTSTFLTKIGYRTITACDPEQALRVIAETPKIDLILTDIILPGCMNGLQLAVAVRELRPSIKIMYASGFPADELGHRNIIIDGNTLLNKPYRLSDLKNAIGKVLHSAGAL